jgi:serine protease Do
MRRKEMKEKPDRKRTKRHIGVMSVAAISICLLIVAFATAKAPLPGESTSGERAVMGIAKESRSPSIPDSFAALAKGLAPTVVNIKVTKVEKVSGAPWPNNSEGPFGDLFRHFFRDMPHWPDKFHRKGMGSGVIISAEGHILTNHHVIEGAKELIVTMADQQEHKARIVGHDAKTDLAVLKIDAQKPLVSAKLGDSGRLEVGDWVLAIGNPFGLSHTVTSGIVSAKGRVIGAGPYDDFIQTDASINPGNSGGPLFNLMGQVVGINTAIVPQGQGIGFAIPINTAKPLIPQLVERGQVIRGYLGVNIQSMTPELAKAMKLKEAKGALVAAVTENSPAAKAGIRRGDVIVGYDDGKIEGARDLASKVAETPVGEKVPVTVMRKGQMNKLSVEVGRLGPEKPETEPSTQADQERWGLRLQELDPRLADRMGLSDGEGVQVVGVQPGSPADRAGIKRGDVILEVNRRQVSSIDQLRDLVAQVEDGDSLLMLVARNNDSFYVALAG